jgi:uncharacterized protein (DUF1330 family)
VAAYVVVEIEVTDPVRYEAYKQMAEASVTAFDGKYIVRGGPVETLEGDWRPARFVVLEFPSAERAREWWSSEMYRPGKALRQATARSQMILVRGI